MAAPKIVPTASPPMMPAATRPLSARDGVDDAITVIAAIAHAASAVGNLVMVFPLGLVQIFRKSYI
jgi:hypothetical protein